MIIEEQEKVLKNDKKNMLVSASAGSGKTYIIIKYITELICEKRVPVKDFVILTFTKAAATEMKERLQKSLRAMGNDPFVVEQLDSLSIANISTIHAFCEKSLKKYANLVGLSSNFTVADENVSQKINQEAFENALTAFKGFEQEKYFELMKFYKNDKNQIRTIMFEIERLANAVAEKEEFLTENLLNPEQFFDRALNFLFADTQKQLLALLSEIENLHLNDFEFLLRSSLANILSSKDIFELSEAVGVFKFPNLPKRKEVGDEIVEKLRKIKLRINATLETVEELNLLDEENISTQRSGELEKLLLELFFLFDKEEQKLKKLKNVLDFSDLEKYMKLLSGKENLFDGIKFVFVDEYQDTNKIQEKIVKNIAKNCNFVAVGDVKQGIYGFRLASCDIFLRDMQDFAEKENSAVNNLKSNFRSSQKVLDFVNDVFKVCMTEESVGLNYLETSMLDGKKCFEEETCRAINLDLVVEPKLEEKPLPSVYSVKKADAITEENNKMQLLAIKNRILQVLKSEIYDEGFRKCRFSDIAILFRSRGELFNDLENFLVENGIPVISNSRNNLFDEVEMKVLLNLLKVALNFDDDIAMLSVLTSALFGFSLEEMTQAMEQANFQNLCKIVKNSEKFTNFRLIIDDFRRNIEIFGIKKAILSLFDKTNYRAYINSQKNQQKLNNFVEKFLNSITESGFEFDLAGLINFFESVEISVVSDASGVEDAVLLTTIHNSKGLEYPIVFIVGCDRSLKKSARNGLVEINEDFGFAVKKYDTEKNQEIVSVKMKAIQKSEAKKDFIEELMIFYVALTRAKNRLYLFGRFDENIFKRYSVQDCDSYFDLIFFALKSVREAFMKDSYFGSESMEVSLIEEIQELSLKKEIEHSCDFYDEELAKQLRKYLDYEYKFGDKQNFKLKESVTSLNKRQLEDELEQYSNDNFSFGGASVDEGNAYHLALKVLDFDKIENLQDLEKELERCTEVLSDGLKFLDKAVLLKNIQILKKIAGGGEVFKEKQFIMKEKLSALLDEVSYDDKILVQGIIDFYVVRNGKIVLIDYKYSNSRSDDYLIKKYRNQLKVYKLALESGLNMPIEKTYLLSLKYGKLIEIYV